MIIKSFCCVVKLSNPLLSILVNVALLISIEANSKFFSISSSSNNDVNNSASKNNYKKVSSKPKKHRKRSKTKIAGMLILFMLVTVVAVGSALVFSSLRNTDAGLRDNARWHSEEPYAEAVSHNVPESR